MPRKTKSKITQQKHRLANNKTHIFVFFVHCALPPNDFPPPCHKIWTWYNHSTHLPQNHIEKQSSSAATRLEIATNSVRIDMQAPTYQHICNGMEMRCSRRKSLPLARKSKILKCCFWFLGFLGCIVNSLCLLGFLALSWLIGVFYSNIHRSPNKHSSSRAIVTTSNSSKNSNSKSNKAEKDIGPKDKKHQDESLLPTTSPFLHFKVLSTVSKSL